MRKNSARPSPKETRLSPKLNRTYQNKKQILRISPKNQAAVPKRLGSADAADTPITNT